MTAANHHRICRQVLELELASAAGAHELQEQAAASFRRGSAPLEALFDRVAGPEELLRVERLELDLGELRGADWRELLMARLLDRLEDSLAGQPRRADREDRSAPRPSSRQAQFDELLFFLAHGRLPWWGHKPRPPWSVTAPRPADDSQWHALGELLRRDHRARARLASTVDDGSLAAVIGRLAGIEQTEQALAALLPPTAGTDELRVWRQRFWLELVDLAFDEGPLEARGRELLRRLVAPAPSRPHVAGSATATFESAGARIAAALPALPRPWRGWAAAALGEPHESPQPQAPSPPAGAEPETRLADREPPVAARSGPPAADRQTAPSKERCAGPRPLATPAPGDAAGGVAPPAEPPTAAATTDPPPAAPEIGRLPAAPSHEPPSRQSVADEAVYVEGAGVVILHPFLEELFANRRLLDDRRFRDEAARSRAVHLLARLTFGTADLPEYDLLLAKLLCAMPWEDPLLPCQIDDQESAACDELLSAVLGHWTALQSASQDWLRQQFFLRDGRLEPVDGGWLLTVERRAQDVLLTRLPWGLGMIRLPWMQDLLYVSWAE